MKSGIYRITCSANQKVYVGSAVNLPRRMGDHLSRLKAGSHKNARLQNAWNKYGESLFSFDIVEYCDRDELLAREQFWIDKLDCCRSGFNISPCARSTLGVPRPKGVYRHTEESKLKISSGNKGKKKPKLAEANKARCLGVELTDGHKAKLSESLKGRIFTDEHRKKISQANKGRQMAHSRRVSKEYVAKKYVITAPNGDVYNVTGLPEFCKTHNLCRSVMAEVASGKIKQGHHKGWRCKFA